jgi:uncharacterized RDD family membrane protein YckC
MPDWTFLIRYGGREIPLGEGDIVLGRSRGCGVRIDEESVSRSHALLTLHGSEVQVRDLGSSNGLFVNGRRVNKETILKNGDAIGLGSVLLSFVAIPPPEVEAKTAMINLEPRMINVEPRPSRSITQFIQPQVELIPPVPPVRPTRSPDEVDIRPEVEDPAVPSRVTASAMTSPPGVLRRLFSGIVDLVVAGAIAALCFAPALVAIVTHASLRERGGGEPVFWVLMVFCGGVAIAAVCVYFLGTLAGRGATLGQKVFRLRVATDDGATPKSGAVLARLLGLLLYVATAGLLFLAVAFDSEGRGIADRISGTRVEKA